jgi:NhaC family Na+:H+ antiporter
MTLTLIIFLVAGFFLVDASAVDVEGFVKGLSSTFHITPWTLLVPLATGVLIALRLPSLAVLFISALLGGVSAVVLQSDVLLSIVGEKVPSAVGYYKALMTTFFASTHVATGSEVLDRLVSTRGMSGMLTTVWLIFCAVSFGGVMYAGGMLKTIADVALACVRGLAGLVGATAFTGALMNVAAGDQYISILITADMFRDAYREKGLESRLLSRTIEDSSTVTSVLVPWNTCAMAQSASLGIATVVYLPFCFFNLISPFMSVIMAAIGWKIPPPKRMAVRGVVEGGD